MKDCSVCGEKHPEIAVPKGTIITCPECGVEIARLRNDVLRHDLIRASDFEGISQEIHSGDLMACQKCGADYFIQGQLHTKDGWMP